MLFVIFIIIVVSVVIFIHELCHALVMLRYGIEIRELGIGFPIPKVPSILIRPPESLKIQTIRINLTLLGGYVRPLNEKEIEALPYSQKAHIYGAGIIGNLITAILFFAGLFSWQIITGTRFNDWHSISVLLPALLVSWVLWRFGRVLCMYVFPFLILLSLGFLLWAIIKGGTVLGPIGLILIALKTNTITDLLIFVFLIMLGLPILNLLPFVPLDGGKITEALIIKLRNRQSLIHRIFVVGGIGIFASLAVFVFLGDIVRLVKSLP